MMMRTFYSIHSSDVHGATVHEIPRTIDVCYNHYNQTLLPNALGDKSVNDAKLRMFKFFPLVYTLCSPQLLQFLCSVYLPRFNREINTRQLPCRSSCDRIYKACSYAINRLKFHWPAEMTCDKFQNGASCYGKLRYLVLYVEATVACWLVFVRGGQH